MGKIRTRILGVEDVEKKQKKEQKEKSTQKKIRAQGLKGGERMTSLEVDEKSAEKMEKAKKLIATADAAPTKEKETSKIKSHVSGKNHKAALKKIDKAKIYTLLEAINLLKKIKYTKFDESVEMHFNVDETGLKGDVAFPHSIGKVVRIKILDDKLLSDIEEGKLDFDILITHPSYMPKLAKFAKVLGPKGLMPNPKAGTISTNPQEVAKKFEKGTVRWKGEPKFPLIHQLIGKISYEEKTLVENAQAFILAVGKAHIQKAVIKSTMSPGIRIDIEKF